MIKLHHLNKSRSKRIIWLLEELGVNYKIVAYQRDSATFLAPPELKKIHPLGKSPVIEHDGLVIAESGAITEYLISKFAPDSLAPDKKTKEHVEYSQWMHFAESSAMFPLLLRLFIQKDGCKTNFVAGYADIEIEKVISYFDNSLEGKKYLVGEKLTGADIMMSFVAEILKDTGELEKFKNIKKYYEELSSRPAFQKANEIEAEHQE